MISREGNRFRVSGSVTIDNVRRVIEEGLSAFEGDELVIDLSGIENMDSSALSMMLEWMREAAKHGRRVRYENLPENLKSLAGVYGVLEELPLG